MCKKQVDFNNSTQLFPK
uniref:Uncharacterized protein n=1 Tax=Rhizophora mucronata TaxID=61149 RepID=A0A2P2Q6P4_RHIMU